MANGARKGAKYEREICVKLSKWWSGSREDLFWRTSQSGGRATSRFKKGQETHGQHGDIAATHPMGESLLKLFAMELKSGYNGKFDLMSCLDRSEKSAKPILLDWIEQAERSKEGSKAKFWLIIYRRDRRESVVIVEREFLEAQSVDTLFETDAALMSVKINDRDVAFGIVKLDVFLASYNASTLKRRLK